MLWIFAFFPFFSLSVCITWCGSVDVDGGSGGGVEAAAVVVAAVSAAGVYFT